MPPTAHAGLEAYAIAGMLLIMAGFIFVVVRSLLLRRRDTDRASRLPLEEDED